MSGANGTGSNDDGVRAAAPNSHLHPAVRHGRRWSNPSITVYHPGHCHPIYYVDHDDALGEEVVRDGSHRPPFDRRDALRGRMEYGGLHITNIIGDGNGLGDGDRHGPGSSGRRRRRRRGGSGDRGDGQERPGSRDGTSR